VIALRFAELDSKSSAVTARQPGWPTDPHPAMDQMLLSRIATPLHAQSIFRVNYLSRISFKFPKKNLLLSLKSYDTDLATFGKKVLS